MSYITKHHNQTIIYWANPVTDGYGGSTYTTPVDIKGRWVDKQVNFIDVAGRELMSKSVIYLGQDVSMGGFLYLGSLNDLDSSVDDTHPKNVDGAEEIRGFTKIPNLKADDFERKAFITGRDVR